MTTPATTAPKSLNKIGLLALDLETTGLAPRNNPINDEKRDAILEVAWTITDFFGGVLSPGGSLLVDHTLYPSDRGAVERMLLGRRDFVRKMHVKSGLLEAMFGGEEPREELDVIFGKIASDLEAAQDAHPEITEWRLFGSSVDFDRQFIQARMEAAGLLEMLSHRVLDLSTVRPLATLLGISHESIEPLEDGKPHRAWYDIQRDLAQWREIVRGSEYLRELGVAAR